MSMVVSAEAKVAPWKRETVEKLVDAFGRYPVVGILDITDLPSSQFQRIRRQLREQAEIKVIRKTLLNRFVEQIAQKDSKLRGLIEHVRGQPALVFTHLNPFKLSRALDASKTSAPAKPGVSSPKEVVIPTGETGFAPGPIVGELQRAGIKARIQTGKVVILEDCQLLKEGDIITKEIADVLTLFGIRPLELCLKLCAAYGAGTLFPAEVLATDEGQVLKQLEVASTNALNLSINVNYPTFLTVESLLTKASTAARNLALSARVPVAEVMQALLAQANAEMLMLAAHLATKDEKSLDEDLRSELVTLKPEAPQEKTKEVTEGGKRKE